MKTRFTVGLPLLLIAGLLSNAAGHSRTVAQTQNPASQDKTPPSYDMKAQAIVDLQELQKKYTATRRIHSGRQIHLAPGTGRPLGQRTVSPCGKRKLRHSHDDDRDRACPRLPAGRIREVDHGQSQDHRAVEQIVRLCLGHRSENVQRRFAKAEKKLGPDANDGDVIYLLVTHNHEHLGQSIAYARINGITPPWTEEAQKKNAKPAADSKRSARNLAGRTKGLAETPGPFRFDQRADKPT